MIHDQDYHDFEECVKIATGPILFASCQRTNGVFQTSSFNTVLLRFGDVHGWNWAPD